jgi:RNA polymerase sigma factor (sigma-70 family)
MIIIHPSDPHRAVALSEGPATTAVVQHYLDALAGDQPAEPIVRELLGRAVHRLRLLCTNLLYRNYPRMTLPPLNLEPDELLGSVVERLLKAMRQARPGTVRQFFALANQHMRWELNDLARRLDDETAAAVVHESSIVAPPDSNESQLSENARRMLEAIEGLPDEEREVFSLVRIQGLTQPEAADVLGVSPKTVQRRLHRSLVLLTGKLGGLQPAPRTDDT